MDKEAFLKKLDNIPNLPTLPVIAFKVNKMLQDDDVSIRMLSETIEKDQAMVSKILKLVNSAFYGFRSKINTISHAITILGLSTIRNAIVSIAVVDAFSGKEAFEGFDITDFWKHSVAVAVTGRHMAEKTRLSAPDEAFVAGILHDVGKVVLAQYFQEPFGQLLTCVRDDGLSFYEAEKKLLPADHAQIGGRLVKKWQLPASLVETITYHHAVMKSAINVNPIMVVHASDYVVNNYKTDSQDGLELSGLFPEAAKIMAAELKALPDWFPAVATEIEQACDFFIEDGR
ncbi:MAG: HDOD domain-containing protein [Deltaproteobacteria bacterium]|nr:HDOD domain-containing protein [Deltaproteobacteria bacterium]